MDIVYTDNVDDSRVVESVYIFENNISIVDDLLLESTLILVVNTGVLYLITSDIVNELAKSNIHIPTEIYVYNENTTDI